MAKLRGRIPEPGDRRLKLLVFGQAGVGKTTLGLHFPSPYIIDTERGAMEAQYVKQLKDNGGSHFFTNEWPELYAEVHSLLTTRHDYRTVVIDSLTPIYGELVDRCQDEIKAKAKSADDDGTAFGRHYAAAARHWKRLRNMLIRLDMNVVITCRSKALYADDMKIVGYTPDGPKGIDYEIDLCLRMDKRGADRVGTVVKSRVAEFADNEQFKLAFAEMSKRYGAGVLDREAVPVVLASAAQVQELTELVALLSVPQDTVDKWLSKASAESFVEMSAEQAGACIAYCTKAITSRKKAE